MASLATTPVSEDEYLRQERLAETKSEFHDGQVFAMAGGSPPHAFLCNRMGALLDRKVPSGCRVHTSDLRIKIARAKTYTYADCSVVCGELELAGDQRDNLLNPILIVEVLSPSSEGYDRGKKFEMYRTIESFREYLLVHQDRMRVEHYSRLPDGSWLLREYAGGGALVAIFSIGMEISLLELYAGTTVSGE